MPKKCDGFTMVELLVSLSIWFILISLLLPHWTIVALERENKKQESIARQVFYEQMIRTDFIYSKEVIRQGRTFLVSFTGNELCVRWTDLLERQKERCGYKFQ
ncbi:competence protein ComGE [Thermolongibacillus altinsuensis]|uniref:Competence protein ComGE n=1 Tax=Thermolongibacillus altinsuensis TaxID=575256 RepID=A0A4R1QE91_9BACL|nr:competence type IV pilus minor pilin ComGE [Thermolongibacillus altinsuensis]TCL48797.1 competence protein ComGE [Thermolongibacillus altinsuensis]